MRHGGVSFLLAAALLTGCAESVAPEPLRPPPPVVQPVAAAGPALPVITLTERIQHEGWITRFWEQLNPAQRRRVTKQLRNNVPRLATEEAEAAPIWDALGLPERDALIFGAGLRGLSPDGTPVRAAARSSPGWSPARDSSGPR